MIRVYALSLNKIICNSEFNNLIAHVSYEKFQRILRYHNFENAQRTLVADFLLRQIICERLKMENRYISFGKDEYGKPFIRNNDDIHFNVSYSGKWIVIAVHDMPIGIDIQRVDPIDYNVAKRFFSKEENHELFHQIEPQRLLYFYDLWTLKESYVKMIGKGLSIPLNTFTIILKGNNIQVSIFKRIQSCYFKQYNIDSCYKLAVCALKNDFPRAVDIKELDKVYEEFNHINETKNEVSDVCTKSFIKFL